MEGSSGKEKGEETEAGTVSGRRHREREEKRTVRNR